MKTRNEIEHFLVNYVTRRVAHTRKTIDGRTPFDSLGVDSAALLEMVGELEEWLGVEGLDSSLPFDFPTIGSLAAELSKTR